MENAVQYRFARYEKKYFITPEQQERLIHAMQPYVTPDSYGKYTLCNIYYDTDDWRIIRASVGKPAYKEKLRVRSYGVPEYNSRIFVELKKKYEDVVYKRRIATEAYMAEPFLRGQAASSRYGQVGREISWFQSVYRAVPKVFIAYDRTAFAGINDPELRITFDSGMRWRDTGLDLFLGDFGQPIIPDGNILMEIKTPGACPLWLCRLLSAEKIFSTSFSKYGTCYLEHILNKKTYRIKKEEHSFA